MSLFRIVALSLAVALLTAPVSRAQQTEAPDLQRGKVVFRTTGGCVNCHGWAADGQTGIDMRSPKGASLRESTLDLDAMIEVIKCGRPGTQMPYHDRAAYRDDRCYGLVMSDFDAGGAPRRGKTLRDSDIANIAAYLQAKVVGLGAPTFQECTDFFDNPAAKACSNLK